MTSEPFLSKRQLSRKLGVSSRTITRRRYPHIRVGGQNRYLLSQVVAACTDGGDELPDNVVPLRPQHEEVVA